MNITNPAGLSHTVFNSYIAGHEHTKNSSNSPNKGFSLEGGEHVMHKARMLKQFSAHSSHSPQPPQLSNSSAEDIRARLEAEGQQRDTKAFVYLDGEPVMKIGKYITARNKLGDIALQNNGDPQLTLNALKSKYGSRITVETFNDTNRPTNAEAFEMFNGIPYEQYVNENYNAMVSSRLQADSHRLAFMQQRLAHQNTPVDSIYKVDGKIIATRGEDEVAQLNMNSLLDSLDALNISRDAAKQLLIDTTGKKLSQEALGHSLKSAFGNKLEVAHLAPQDRPTRKQVSDRVTAQESNLLAYNNSKV